MNIIPATAEMLNTYCPIKVSVNALAAVEGDKVLGISGLYLQGNKQVIFSWISDEMKSRRKDMIKAWREVLKLIRNRSLPTYAVCDFSIPKAELFLLHLGFVPFNGNVWIFKENR